MKKVFLGLIVIIVLVLGFYIVNKPTIYNISDDFAEINTSNIYVKAPKVSFVFEIITNLDEFDFEIHGLEKEEYKTEIIPSDVKIEPFHVLLIDGYNKWSDLVLEDEDELDYIEKITEKVENKKIKFDDSIQKYYVAVNVNSSAQKEINEVKIKGDDFEKSFNLGEITNEDGIYEQKSNYLEEYVPEDVEEIVLRTMTMQIDKDTTTTKELERYFKVLKNGRIKAINNQQDFTSYQDLEILVTSGDVQKRYTNLDEELNLNVGDKIKVTLTPMITQKVDFSGEISYEIEFTDGNIYEFKTPYMESGIAAENIMLQNHFGVNFDPIFDYFVNLEE